MIYRGPNRVQAMLLFVMAVVVNTILCLYVYPPLGSALRIDIDPDAYGRLGKALFEYGTIAYYPELDPTTHRGPIYPLLVAFAIWLNPGSWLLGLQLIHTLLISSTSVLVYLLATRLTIGPWPFVAGLTSVFHPYLLWFVPRVFIEPLSIFLFTLLMLLLVDGSAHQSTAMMCCIGITLGVLVLAKVTFLPFVALIPFAYWSYIGVPGRRVLILLLAAIVVILPWSYRNWRLTHTFIPVQTGLGKHMAGGDGVLDYFPSTEPRDLIDRSHYTRVFPVEAKVDAELGPNRPKWQMEIEVDRRTLQASLDRYMQQPFFLLRKLVFNAWAFWFLTGDHPLRVALILLQVASLVCFLYGSYRVVGSVKRREARVLPIGLSWVYFCSHLPVIAGARFSVVLLPTILAYAIAGFSHQGSARDAGAGVGRRHQD
jgi:hypothetical protein